MNRTHIGIGLVVIGLVAVGFAVLELNASPDDQHLVIQNDFADADCRMDFANGAHDAFSVRKDVEYRKTHKAPREGFINMRCTTPTGAIDIPGSLNMPHGILTRVTLKSDGTGEYTFERLN